MPQPQRRTRRLDHPIVARRASWCLVCGARIEIGDLIERLPDVYRYVHAACLKEEPLSDQTV